MTHAVPRKLGRFFYYKCLFIAISVLVFTSQTINKNHNDRYLTSFSRLIRMSNVETRLRFNKIVGPHRTFHNAVVFRRPPGGPVCSTNTKGFNVGTLAFVFVDTVLPRSLSRLSC